LLSVTFSAFPSFTPDFEFGNSKIKIEVKGPDFYLFTVDPRNGQPFREEYCVASAQGILQASYAKENDVVKELRIENYDSMETIANKTYFTKQLQDGTIFRLKFEFRDDSLCVSFDQSERLIEQC